MAGIGADFTACTVLPVLADGTPLCVLPELAERPHAYAKLWKHHAAQPQAERVTELARTRGEDWLARYGGRVSAEWELPKALELLEQDPELYARAARLVEAADWIVWQLCGRETRCASVAGYKGLYQDGGYPSRDYLRALDPRLEDFARCKLMAPDLRPGQRAGALSSRAADWTGLPVGIAVAAGNIDAHVTAPAALAIEPGRMVAVLGTSTCHLMVSERLVEFPGLGAVVRDGIVPGAWGYEAGQSGVGDIFAWYVSNGVPAAYEEQARALGRSTHQHLTALAGELRAGESGLLALDWWSGNRSVLMDNDLRGVIVGLGLATHPPEIYRALLESTAFGTRRIIASFAAAGLPVRELIAAGGLVENELLLQIYADVTGLALGVIAAPNGAALGAAMQAAVAAGVHRDIGAAAAAMARVRHRAYLPDPARAETYGQLYALYLRLHDWFGRDARVLQRELGSIAARARAAPGS